MLLTSKQSRITMTAMAMQDDVGSHKCRVLVVDDEPLLADTLVQILNLFGYKASVAYNPTQALEFVRTHGPYEVVISDVVMRGHMSGIDLAIRLKSVLPTCKVLLMSGNNSTADLIKAAEQQGHTIEVLAKPVHPNDVLDRLKEMLA